MKPRRIVRRAAPEDAPLLEVDELRTTFDTARGTVVAVDGVSLRVDEGQTLGIVGESGSGKTVLARSILQLVSARNATITGRVRLRGRDLVGLSAKAMRSVWGVEGAMVFQDPMTSLNGTMRVGDQITESLRYHLDMSRGEAHATALALLRSVGIPEPEARIRAYPHQLSGGMRQRVTIAVALACGPRLLVADEPTTALDVTIQRQILDLLGQQKRERAMGMVLITHDLGVVAGRADRVAVMYAGKVVERGPTRVLFHERRHPYTDALLRSIPRLSNPGHTRLQVIPGRPPDLVALPEACRVRRPLPPRAAPVPGGAAAAGRRRGRPRARVLLPGRHRRGTRRPGPQRGRRAQRHRAAGSRRRHRRRHHRRHRHDCGGLLMAGSGSAALRDRGDIVLRVERLVVEFPLGRQGRVQAVSDVSFDVARGETLGLVGESGCGKSTTAKAIMQAPRPTSGRVTFEGRDLGGSATRRSARSGPRCR